MVRRESDLVGGRLCLDFVNTVSSRGTDEPRDNLDSYPQLLRWSARAGALSRTGAATLRRVAAEHPLRAAAALARSRELREAIYRVLFAWKRGRAPGKADLALVNGSAPARGELVWRRGRLAWANEAREDLDSPLWPVVWSLAAVVTSGEPRRVSSCGSAECGWVFYDGSRGQRRRWCSMQECGNRAKARRHYARVSRSV